MQTVLKDDLPSVLAEVLGDRSQMQVQRETGEPQPRVSLALQGQDHACARRLIEHYTGRDVREAYVID